MSCLLVMDLEKSERLKKQGELRTLYATLMDEGHTVIGAQHCSLFLLDPTPSADGQRYLTSMGWKGKPPTRSELMKTFKRYDIEGSGSITPRELYQSLRRIGWTAELSEVEAMVEATFKARKAELTFDDFCTLMREAVLQDEVRLTLRQGGTRDHVLSTGRILNVRDVDSDVRIDAESRRRYQLRGYDVKSLLVAPVFGDDGKTVVGLIELVNKECETDDEQRGGASAGAGAGAGGASGTARLVRRNSEYGFSADDEKLLSMLSHHCSIFLRHLEMG